MFETTRHKYIRLERYNEFIFFPEIIEHSQFRNLKPISAGFCYLDNDDNIVNCFGESVSLGLKSKEDDTKLATKQVYGYDAMLAIQS